MSWFAPLLSGRHERLKKKKSKRLMDAADSGETERAQGFNARARTLSPTSSNAMNRLHSTPSHDRHTSSKIPNGTIRSVPAETLQIDTSAGNYQVQNSNNPPALPQLTRGLSPLSNQFFNSQSTKTGRSNLTVSNGVGRTISAEFGPTRAYNSVQTSEETNGSRSTSPGSSQWSSAIGGATTGKSGRVIEKLMSDNDTLKREMKLERLRHEESKQDATTLKAKNDALIFENESNMHDAAVAKALLKRRDRQLTDLKAQIDGEKARADYAVERERGWKEEMERTIVECKAEVDESKAKIDESKLKVEEAQSYALLMEGRNQVMENHWKEQSVEISQTVENLGEEIDELVLERKKDDDRINMLQGLCDQQAAQLEALAREKENIAAHFEAYKREQEDALRAIKTRAIEQERANEKIVEESKKVLGELKWALAVKDNVRSAQ
jgi:hypothetical protein